MLPTLNYLCLTYYTIRVLLSMDYFKAWVRLCPSSNCAPGLSSSVVKSAKCKLILINA